MNRSTLKKMIGNITRIHTETVTLDEPFIHMAGRFAHLDGTVILLSGGDLDCARHHILATYPFLTLSGRHRQMTLTTASQTHTCEEDPFSALKNIVDCLSVAEYDGDLPVAAGMFGYLSYDLKDVIEILPRTSVDPLGLPHLYFTAPSMLVIHDKKTGNTTLSVPVRDNSLPDVVQQTRKKFHDMISRPLSHQCHGHEDGQGKGFVSNFTRDTYMEAVGRIREYIASGHVYQVNMSQRFETDFSGNPYGLFRELYHNNPAPFFAFINANDHAIVSTSPERFLLQEGDRVESRPIKGTRPRGASPREDQDYREELEQSPKDDAELSMIVDLIRNDMGKVCRADTVKVSAHKQVEAYQNVYHLVSIVEGMLEPSSDGVDLIKATFPGGSITGCPKIRSMEIIDELETVRRHIYTGSIGYISFHRTMDLSIAIRTATIVNDRLFFSVGGGVVYDSDPLAEYRETLHKGKTLLDTLNKETSRFRTKQTAWVNGALLAMDDATVSIADLGFQYGYGFFETLRVDQGQIGFLSAHIDRFNHTWRALYPSDPPDITWEAVIDQVIQENNLQDKTAAVKIMSSFGCRHTRPFDHGLFVTCRPYVHRLANTDRQGLRLATCPHARQSMLADHKSLNYLFYLMSGNDAKTKGADEALILNPDNTISETNTANILLISDNTIILPESDHVLPGIMQHEIVTLMTRWGYKPSRKKIHVGDLFDADLVIVSNSLMGAVAATHIDGKPLNIKGNLIEKINRTLFPPHPPA